MRNPSRIGVVLFNLGGPWSLPDVEPFLVRLFSDRGIIRLPGGAALQPFTARVIARLRAASVRRHYQLIGGGSPQLAITTAQARALERRLNRDESRYHVVTAMRYAHPGADEALAELNALGITRIVTLPLFPQRSSATTGSSEQDLWRALRDPRWRGCAFDISLIASYADDSGYVSALTATVRDALNGFEPAARDQVVILFSAHGLPCRFVEAGDPYVREVEATRVAVLTELDAPNRHALAYQSRTGPVRWTGPGTDKVLADLAREGVQHVLVVPLSFVSDHIETLYELDVLFATLAGRLGITDYRRAPALNTHPLFIEALAGIVERHVSERPDADRVHGAA